MSAGLGLDPYSRGRVRLVGTTILAKLTILGIGIYGVLQGVGILVGGPQRFGAATYAALRLAPVVHPAYLWGSLVVLCGVLTLVGSLAMWWWVKSAGLVGLAIWSLLLANGAWAALELPSTGTTAAPTYVLVAYICLVLIFVHERTPERPPDAA